MVTFIGGAAVLRRIRLAIQRQTRRYGPVIGPVVPEFENAISRMGAAS